MHPYAAPFNYYYSTPYGQMGMNPMPMNMGGIDNQYSYDNKQQKK